MVRRRDLLICTTAAASALVLGVVFRPPPSHDGRAETTRRFMRYAGEAFYEQAYGRKTVPWSNKAEAMKAAGLRVPQDVWRDLAEGNDPWGRPMQFRRSADGKEAMLWSTGPNGIDEQGQGDDIAARIAVPDVASTQSAGGRLPETRPIE